VIHLPVLVVLLNVLVLLGVTILTGRARAAWHQGTRDQWPSGL
jgi:hypothetical protein